MTTIVGSAAAHAQSVFRQAVDVEAFRPTAIAAGPNGTVYVADDVTETIQRYDSTGSLLDVFDSPVKSLNERITDLAVSRQGDVYASWSNLRGWSPQYQPWRTSNAQPGGNSGLTRYSPTGQLLENWDLGNAGLTSVTVGPNDRVFVGSDRLIAEVGPAGQLLPVVDTGLRDLRQLEYSPSDGRLYALAGRTGGEVVAYDLFGKPSHQFAVDHPELRQPGVAGLFASPETATALAVGAEGLYLTDNMSGSVRKYSLDGVLLDVGFGVTRTEGLAIAPDGSLIAAMPQSQTVERIGDERFDPGHGGVTLLSKVNRRLVSGPASLWGGFDGSHGWTESPAGTFVVPGEPGEMVEVTFHYVSGSHSVLRVFPVDSVNAEPTEEPTKYFREAYESAYTHLVLQEPRCARAPDVSGCEGVDPSLIETARIEAGTEIGFLHLRNQVNYQPYGRGIWVPNALEQSMQITGSMFESLAQLSDEEYAELMTRSLEDPIANLQSLQPLASDSRANWGRIDQFAFFLSEDATFLAMEDLSQAGFSDLSYRDATLRIGLRLIPVPIPEPAAAGLGIGGLALSLTAAGRPRRR